MAVGVRGCPEVCDPQGSRASLHVSEDRGNRGWTHIVVGVRRGVSVGPLVLILGAPSPQMPSEWVTFESKSPGPREVHPRSPVQPDTQTRSLGSPLMPCGGSVRSSWTLTARLPTLSPGSLVHFWGQAAGRCTQSADPRHGVSGHNTPRPPGATRYPGAGRGPAGTDGLRVGLEGGHRRELLGSRPLPQEAGVRSGSHETEGLREASASACPAGSGRWGPEAGLAPQATVKQLLRRIPRKHAPKRHFRLADKTSFQISEDLLGREFVVCVCLDTLR